MSEVIQDDDFCVALIKAREAKNYTQTALAKLVGVTQQSISGWESGRFCPSSKNCADLSSVLGVEIAHRGMWINTLPISVTKYSHYYKDVDRLTHIDVYRVLDLFQVTRPAVAHAVKKLLAPGQRGTKDYEADIREALVSLERELQMLEEDRVRPIPVGEEDATRL